MLIVIFFVLRVDYTTVMAIGFLQYFSYSGMRTRYVVVRLRVD